jgi:hypothetical protein
VPRLVREIRGQGRITGVQLGQRGQRWKFLFNEVDGASTGEGMVEAFLGGSEVAETERRLAVQPGGADEVEFVASNARQLPSSLGERQCLPRLPQPEMALGEPGGDIALALLIA